MKRNQLLERLWSQFGFKPNDNQRAARQGMLDLLRDGRYANVLREIKDFAAAHNQSTSSLLRQLAIRTLAAECRVPVGLSDHGEDTFALSLAVGLGASIYERHIVLPDDMDAADRAVSSTPVELAAAIRAGRRAWSALGSGRKACLAAEAPNQVASRRSLCAIRDMAAGQVVAADDFLALRPGSGIAPSNLGSVIGRRLNRPLAAGQPLTTAHLDAVRIPETDRVA